MEISLTTDTITVATKQGLGFANSLLHRSNHVSATTFTVSEGVLRISAAIFDALAPPPVKSKPHATSCRTRLRKKRRTRRRSIDGGETEDDGECNGHFDFGDGSGPFGGGWGGGSGWNFNEFGGQNWEEPFRSSDFAYGFVYEVVIWIALSNCVHFAFNKVVRLVSDDAERQKVSMGLASVC